MNSKDLAVWIIGLKDIRMFYKSTMWRRLRKEVLTESNNECQMCKERGVFEPGTVAHHIKHVGEHPELALTKSNLLCICEPCHYALHHTIKYKVQLNAEKWD